MHPDFSPFEPAPSPADRDMSTLKDVLSGCALAIGIPGIFLILMAFGG